jgi:DNA polymerase epsilon subunit 2
MFKQLAMTLLQESHLCPVPLESQAVYWQHDHALALYPLPHLLVLADSVPPNSTTFEGCHCLNPVRIASSKSDVRHSRVSRRRQGRRPQ